jgi:hypothetical protein
MGNSLNRRKMTLGGNRGLQKGMKTPEMVKSVSKYKIIKYVQAIEISSEVN